MIKFIIIFLILVLIFYLINKFINIKREKFISEKSKIIWTYWETLPGKKKPGYIDLCINSIKFNCGKCFKINVLYNQWYLVFLAYRH